MHLLECPAAPEVAILAIKNKKKKNKKDSDCICICNDVHKIKTI